MTEIIHHPGPNDVLCGRGGATNNHVGNKRFRALVYEYQPEYLNTKKRDKRSIARAIVAVVKSRGGRFLKKVGDGTEEWYDVGDKKATEKTSQALREGLDARSLAAKGIKPPQVRDGSDGTSSVEEQPPRKRRRTTGPSHAIVASSQLSSPALVSEIDPPNEGWADFSLGLNDEELYSNAAAVFEASPPSAEDVGEIVAL